MTAKRNGVEQRREKCRNKEARRAEQINGAFNKLLSSIPYIPDKQRATIPKIKTLRLAAKYINHLSQLLEGQWAFDNNVEPARPLQFEDFKHIADGEIKVRNSYRERAQKTEMDYATVQRIQARHDQRRRRHKDHDNLKSILHQPTTVNCENQFESHFHSQLHPSQMFAAATTTAAQPNFQYSTFYPIDHHPTTIMMPPLPSVQTLYGSTSSSSSPEFSLSEEECKSSSSY